MHAMVTARVPLEIRDQVNAKLRSIGSSPTELVNAAYDYVLATDAQANELRFRLRQATRPVPASFWEARDGAPATRGGE